MIVSVLIGAHSPLHSGTYCIAPGFQKLLEVRCSSYKQSFTLTDVASLHKFL